MLPQLLAFDLDGTLLTNDKRLSPANRAALVDMVSCGCIVALASGRIGSSMTRYVEELGMDPALVTLNGAAVYTAKNKGGQLIYSATLPPAFSDELVRRSEGMDYALNYYYNGFLYGVRTKKTAQWMDLYYAQTGAIYESVDSLQKFSGLSPFKIIFVGDSDDLDGLETAYRKEWDNDLYIVRTWDYYLEFLSLQADKGNGIAALAKAYDIDLDHVVTFGDANNDIPMFLKAGTGIAMKNASNDAKKAATHVSAWTNDEDGVAREWERLKAQ